MALAEATYAYKKKKHVIPLLIESEYKPEGWLDILIGTKLYYKVFSVAELKKNISAITKAIGIRGRGGGDVDGKGLEIIEVKVQPY